MKEFLYLFQGRSDLIENYLYLKDQENADAIFLTYDKQIDSAIYLPKSTWAEGRNELLKRSIIDDKYLYYVFCDDDIEFKKGGWDKFEQYLLLLKPAIGVPVFSEKTKKTPLNWLKYNSILFNDEQMIAYHKDVLFDNIIMPLQNQFDKIHWWATCQVQQILIQNFYAESIIQLNKIVITNEIHERYPKLNQFEEQIHSWLVEQFISKYSDIELSIRKNLHKILYRTISFFIRRHLFSKNKGYSISEEVLRKKLDPKSDLLKQYLESKLIRTQYRNS